MMYTLKKRNTIKDIYLIGGFNFMEKEEMIKEINEMDDDKLLECISFLLNESPKFREHLLKVFELRL